MAGCPWATLESSVIPDDGEVSYRRRGHPTRSRAGRMPRFLGDDSPDAGRMLTFCTVIATLGWINKGGKTRLAKRVRTRVSRPSLTICVSVQVRLAQVYSCWRVGKVSATICELIGE